jgi:hypothetical protein
MQRLKINKESRQFFYQFRSSTFILYRKETLHKGFWYGIMGNREKSGLMVM